jgi:hypothetical protein
MSIIFNKLEKHIQDFRDILESRSFLSEETHPFPWENKIYISANIRRAHLDVVDARDTKKLLMMHLCVFPKIYSDAPIYGFDLIAGPTKVTGAFHDFSPSGNKDHELSKWFANEVKDYEWSKPRELPEWAKNIFSPSMVAAGNINSEFELNEILDLSKRSLEKYLDTLHILNAQHSYEYKIENFNYTKEQNWYCQNQKRNPHTPRVMQSLGFDEETVNKFIQECLFPEV